MSALTQRVSFSLSQEEVDVLDALAAKAGKTRAVLVRERVSEMLARAATNPDVALLVAARRSRREAHDADVAAYEASRGRRVSPSGVHRRLGVIDGGLADGG